DKQSNALSERKAKAVLERKRINKAMLCPEKRLKLRKKTRAVLEWKRINKATLCPEKRLKLRKKTISTHSLTSSLLQTMYMQF
ncbi:hypothetical protein ACFMJT_22590, partial [Acinetobacter baumannii]